MSSDQAEKLRADAIARDLQQPPESNWHKAGKCRVIAVSSGKGGVGKTSMVLNLGLSLINMDYRVVIIDADLGLANIDVMLNTMPRYSLSDVVNGEKSLRDIMINGPLDLKVIPGSSGIYDLANLDQIKRQLLLDQLKTIEEDGDFILIDTAAGISRNVLSFIGAADDFILVTTPEPTALTDAYGMLKVLNEKKLKDKSQVVVNSTRTVQQGYKTFCGLKKAVDQYLPAMAVTYLGEVRYDHAVSSAVHNFSPFVLSKPRSAASTAVKRIAWRLASNNEADQQPEKGLAAFIKRMRELT